MSSSSDTASADTASADATSADLWPTRVWTDSPADLAQAPAWEIRIPGVGVLTEQRIAAAPGPVIYGVVAGVCLVLGLLVSWRGEVHEASAGFWPPAGAALVALLASPVRKWAWALAGAVTPTVAGIVTGVVPANAGLWWAVGNAVEPLLAATVIMWFAWSRWLTRFRLFVVAVAAGVFVGPMVGGAFGATGTSIGYAEPWFDVWAHWVITDGLGVLIVTPMIISLTPHKPMRRSRSELLALVLLMATVAALTFADIGANGAALLPYLILVGLVWAGIRFGTRPVAVAGFVVALAANVAVAGDLGPFAESSNAADSLTLQVFLIIALTTAFMVALLAGDLADRDEVEALLTHRATHDPLTGLPNRAWFTDRLDLALESDRNEGNGEGRGCAVAVVLVDLDDFKKVNDRHGHLEGDLVLTEIARRLQRSLPPGDVLARFTGDMFVAMVDCTAGVEAVDGVARRLSAALDPPIDVQTGFLHTVSCRMGVALAIGDGRDDRPATSTDLLRCADIALNQVGNADDVRISFYDEELEAETLRQVQIAEDFVGAVERGEISVVYQPLVSLRSGRVTEFESLARWHSSRFGWVPPDEFVVVAERSNLIGAFGDFVLETACRQLVEWRTHRPQAADLRVSVNVSARQLCDLMFPNRVAAVLAATTLPADALTLEITETAVMDDLELTSRVLHELRGLGLRLAMDDFGTGYSSMTNLRLVELDTLKIDRSFVDGVGELAEDTAIVRSIINLGHSFGLTVVAEGVETEQQRHHLVTLGCDHGQGYLWSRPVAPDEAAHLLDAPFPLPEADRTPAGRVPRT